MSPSKKPRVLLTGEIDWAHEEWNALRDVATLEVKKTIPLPRVMPYTIFKGGCADNALG